MMTDVIVMMKVDDSYDYDLDVVCVASVIIYVIILMHSYDDF